MKDNFSKQADLYVKFRPSYPMDLFRHILGLVKDKSAAWDCGTGNGQVAAELSKYFTKVYATDISQAQLDHAVKSTNIEYVRCPAEKTPFKDDLFDLITVGQAIHWFDFGAFYKEVKRTARKNAIIAVWGYGLLKISPEIDPLVNDFYTDTVGKYWDHERKYVDDSYQTIPFDFEELPSVQTSIEVAWRLEEFIGYLNTWSSVQKFIKEKNTSPLNEFRIKLAAVWENNQVKKISFPVFMRIGRVV